MNTNQLSSLVDTRSSERVSVQHAVINSQPESSGGLYTPLSQELPQFSADDIQAMVDMSYTELAKCILGRIDWGIPKERVDAVIEESYGKQWHHPDITPVKSMGGKLYSLHLGHGPTFAFKNIALEFLPRMLAEMTKEKIAHVLGASSGDTINAAHNGVKGTNIRSIFMLPATGPSVVQRLQAVQGIVDNPNALTILADAPFDPLQDVVKKVNGPEYASFKKEYNITSFNSINIARILAQTVYYFRAGTQLIKMGIIKNGEEIIFSVPSGNFGDALAGFYAREMGLPTKLINAATNENDMLHRFFETGIYEPPKKDGKDLVIVTNAPSQDIAKSSNFERALHWATQDPEKVASWYRELKDNGRFKVDDRTLTTLRKVFTSSTCTDRERIDVIKMMGKSGHGIDPHTATGLHPALQGKLGKETPIVALETSHVAQFGEYLRGQGIVVPGMEQFDETINAMKGKEAVEGVHYLRTGASFDEIFASVKEAIKILATRN